MYDTLNSPINFKKMKIKMKFLLSALILYSCISCTPRFSTQAIEKTTTTWGATDALFQKVIQSQDKSYGSYSGDYAAIDGEIAALQEIDRARAKSKIIVKILTDIQNRFDTYESEHKGAGNINDAQARAYKYGMDALWKELYNTEMNLNK